MPLSALVLTAGLGTRLDPLTRLVAKPAVPLGDRTLVERVLAWLRAQGVHDVVLNLHHKPETITAVVGDGAHLGLRVRYSWERQVLGSAGGPRHALPLMNTDPFLIVNGDTLCDFELGPMLAFHRESRARVTMAVVPNESPDHYGGLVLDSQRFVTAFVPRGPAAASSWHFVGVQIAAASVFAGLADNEPRETVKEVYREMIAAEPASIAAWPVATTFIDVGTPADYLRAALRFTAGADARPGITDSVVWPNVQLGRNVRLTRCIVAGPQSLPDDFEATDRILMPEGVRS